MTSLFSEFELKHKAEWLEKVSKDLKGKPLDSLNWHIQETTANQLSVSPFAHREDIKGNPYPPLPFNRTSNSWEIGTFVVVNDFHAANLQALTALKNGANAICFQLEKTPNKADLRVLLVDIQLEWISIHFLISQKNWKALPTNFIDIIKEKGQNSSNVSCSFRFSGDILETSEDYRFFRHSCLNELPRGHFLTVNDLDGENEEVIATLASTLRKGNIYLNTLNHAELGVKDLYHTLQFTLQLDDHYLLNIAKIRAFKLLWAQVFKAWNLPVEIFSPIEVHLSPSSQSSDEDYNKIKATAQAMSAIIGGANRLFIHPSDSFTKENGTPFSQRIALNVQHLMQQESYIDRVIDPAAGSYFIENLTETLAQKAWAAFQQLEASQK